MIARRKAVVEPADAVTAPPATTIEPATPARVVVFWKAYPSIVKFEDGTSITFRGNKLVTADETLIQNIKTVMAKNGIVVANGEPI